MIRFSIADAKSVNELIRKRCCNYNDGNCILLDNGDSCICPQTISYSLLCKWFRTAVLPNDSELYAKLIKPQNTRHCKVCGAEYVATGRNSKYCGKCKELVLKRQKAEHIRKKRHKCRNFKL